MKGIILAFFCLLAIGNPSVSSAFERPILYESSYDRFNVSSPDEQRDEKYARFLSVSLKIHVNGASGSGTICHYDRSSGIAHVISCGHLWSGNMNYDKTMERPKAKLITWYKNSSKLERPETFDAEVLFWSNDRGHDVSLLRFRPDWHPEFAAIDGAFKMEPGMSLNSLGCDGGREVARYEVRFKELNGMDIITIKNSPRPGRSGGGLVTDSGRMVGVCWGTSDVSSGKGIGYFTPVSSIKRVFVRNDHGWLLELFGARSIPVMDAERPDMSYPNDFVPIPASF